MGTTLKKRAKKKNGNGNGTKIAAAFATLSRQIDTLALEASTQCAMIEEGLEDVHRNWAFPQEALEAALILARLQKTVAAAYKKFEEQAKRHREAGGGFTDGRVAISFPETSSRRPKWKEEAVALAVAAGKSEKAYIKEVEQRTTPSTLVKVKLTENAG